jgi:type I restriction enzyme M protein
VTSRAALRNAIWQACTAIRNEHRDVKKYVEYTAVLLFLKFYDDLYDTLPGDVRRLIPERYRWGTLKRLDPRGFAGFNPEVLVRLREFFEGRKWRGKAAFGVIFENFTFDIKHDEVLGQALIALDRIDFVGIDYDQKGDLYEFLISKMADAGVKGEFFTPRSIVNMIIELLRPRAGMRVWDPACGTAGFLARAFEVMRTDIELELPDGSVRREEALEDLRTRSLYGCETEAASARLARMNMLLRGDGHSTILEFNSLDRQTYALDRVDLRGERVPNPLPGILADGFDLIMANPPYGGSQAVSDVGTLLRPWTRTRKPEANFLQVMMHGLRPGGRCGVVMPEGVLFRRDEARIRERLLRDYHLEAVVGLFQGAFEFADVKACVLFFRRPKPSERWKGTREVWIADTHTIADIELIPRHYRIDGEHGRVVGIDELQARGLNLRPRYYLALPGKALGRGATIGELFDQIEDVVMLDDATVYRQITIRTNGQGATLRQEVRGADVATKRQFRVAAGDLVVSKIDARHGAFAIVPDHLDGGIVSTDFPVFRARGPERLSPELLAYCLRYGPLADQFARASQGTTNRQRVRVSDILETVLPCPSPDQQEAVVARLRMQQAIGEKAAALLEGVTAFQWLDEAMFEVPDDLVIAETFDPLVEDASEYVEPASEPDTWWQLYSMSNISGVGPGDKKRGSEFTLGRRYKRVVADAIVYAVDRVNVGTVGIMPVADDHSIISPYRVVFRCLEGLSPQFLSYVMKSPSFRRRIREAQVGAVRNELHFPKFREIPFRVPVIERQLEIVAQIDEQVSAYQRVKVITEQAEATMRSIVGELFAAAE